MVGAARSATAAKSSMGRESMGRARPWSASRANDEGAPTAVRREEAARATDRERGRDHPEIDETAAPAEGGWFGVGQDAVEGGHRPEVPTRAISGSSPVRSPTLQPADVADRARLAFGHGRLPAQRREPPRPAGRPGVRRGRDPAPHPRLGREGRGPSRDLREDGRAGLPRRADPRGVGRLRDGLPQLRDPVRGARAGRHRVPGRPERPRRAELAGAAAVGDRGAEAALARAAGTGREARDVRAHRARGRHGCGEPRDDGPARRRRLPPERPEDLDQPRRPRRPLPGLRLGRPVEGLRGRDRVPARARDGRACRPARSTASSASGPATPGSSTSTTCVVPAEHRIGEEGEGFLDRDERDRPGPLHGRGGRRRARPGVPRRVASSTPTSARRSARRSAVTSSSSR